MQTLGIVLAGGKGTRLNSTDRNKTTLEVGGKPMIAYAAELYQAVADHTMAVIGAFPETVQAALKPYYVTFALQEQQLGTGHAVKVAVQAMHQAQLKPRLVLVGYGDHMMFYTPVIIEALKELHQTNQAAITLVTTTHPDPNGLAWGRIIRDENGNVVAIVEQKDATPEQRQITEVNAGFYCFDADFLATTAQQLAPSPVTGEYYITDLVAAAVAQKRVVMPFEVPFELVGTGINTLDQLHEINSLLQN